MGSSIFHVKYLYSLAAQNLFSIWVSHGKLAELFRSTKPPAVLRPQWAPLTVETTIPALPARAAGRRMGAIANKSLPPN
jgi:hypothetical protein